MSSDISCGGGRCQPSGCRDSGFRPDRPRLGNWYRREKTARSCLRRFHLSNYTISRRRHVTCVFAVAGPSRSCSPAMALSRARNGVRLGVWFKGRFAKWPAYEPIAFRLLFFWTVGAESGWTGLVTRFHKLLNSNNLGNGVTVARLTLDQLVGVQIPIPQFS